MVKQCQWHGITGVRRTCVGGDYLRPKVCFVDRVLHAATCVESKFEKEQPYQRWSNSYWGLWIAEVCQEGMQHLETTQSHSTVTATSILIRHPGSPSPLFNIRISREGSCTEHSFTSAIVPMDRNSSSAASPDRRTPMSGSRQINTELLSPVSSAYGIYLL